MMFGRTLLAAGLITATSASAWANDFNLNEPELYVGGGYGQYSIKYENDDTDFDDDAEVLKVYGGMKFNEFLGAEIGYLNFDEANSFDDNAEIDGFTFAGIVSAPLHERFSVYARAGWFTWDAKLKTTVPVIGEISEDIDGGDWFYGGGLKFGLTTNLDLRLEYDRYELDDDIKPEVDVASVNLQYSF
ncbi:outer membrane beta-barrel protein [Simiduia sp. 21SJ11W-1]|uniref:outer membrane beta-barrel protein n=1 Tax=Simiduia sp. 21SJ11W-1 TaxID=2909669 RepID=UPI00209DD3D6|nr:outer membrane beta-barrel protein [Simiduia sp. 21SJ11W-1]UTA48519.1 outer membrane beta-barrel protein [Simiduia sp. 21SJ11W-1]